MPTMTLEQYENRTLGLGNPGICLTCGAEQEGCEPDAHGYLCETCGAMDVSGLEEALLSGDLQLVQEF